MSSKDKLSNLELSAIQADTQRELYESTKKDDSTPFVQNKKLANTQSLPNFNPKLVSAPKKEVKQNIVYYKEL